MYTFHIFFVGLISFLVITEGKPYVSGVLPRLERERLEKERLRRTTERIPDERENDEKWWPQDGFINQDDRRTYNDNNWKPNYYEDRQRFIPTTDRINNQDQFPYYFSTTTSYPDKKYQSRIIFRDERDLTSRWSF
ncbi:hypothetical protein O3M35_013011 [Rhynocoris fuscipes]|uniref:Uncharacterized protein n=1 Tax=Rhynocoris fuscipes TaxID=488301 RepID=A0AAW1CEY3_9HEMI